MGCFRPPSHPFFEPISMATLSCFSIIIIYFFLCTNFDVFPGTDGLVPCALHHPAESPGFSICRQLHAVSFCSQQGIIGLLRARSYRT
uniref:Uncharacterized protein n=1 Tax=Crocodylus porosus TaxID=8502 RepID=A0A7M4DXC5_CROPO